MVVSMGQRRRGFDRESLLEEGVIGEI